MQRDNARLQRLSPEPIKKKRFVQLTGCAIGVYSEGVEFIETPTFTRLIGKLMNEEDLAADEIKVLKRLVEEFKS